jgi:cytochrome c biogenesis protein CcdA/thiol-disulfide isomerase/thioredoxin
MLGVGARARGRRLAAVLAGLVATFVGLTVVVAAALAAAGITTSGLRIAAAVVVGLVGTSLVIPSLARPFERLAARPAGIAAQRLAGAEVGSGFLLGSALGVIWAPCAGPLMAAVIASAATRGPTPEAVLVALAYAGGGAIPLALVAVGGRRAIGHLGSPIARARLSRSFGLVMALSATLVVSGLDLPLEAAMARVVPGSIPVLSVDGAGAVSDQAVSSFDRTGLPRRAGATPTARNTYPPLPAPLAADLPAVALQDLGPAPDLSGITAWINSPPLTLESLRGKVVLVHFWTFACVNCLDVQPYVKAWYERYAPAGFDVVGVHTPELSFERDLANVRAAGAADGIRFPVAFDPGFATWNAYHNRYWPAFYFVDRHGDIRHVHFGEGDYAGSEAVIRELLSEAA